jgi:TorA maturation chaperone TorD
MSDPKKVVIVSPSPLFREVLVESLSARTGFETCCIEACGAGKAIVDQQPNVIVLDEAIEAGQLGQLLAAARSLPSTLIILVNQRCNDFVVLDSHRAIFRKADDLINTIEKAQHPNESHSGNPLPLTPEVNAQMRASMYGFLATILNRPPDADLIRRLRAVGATSFVAMTQASGGDSSISEGLSLISNYIDETAEQGEQDVQLALRVDWTRLFRGVDLRHGPPPPYEGLFISAPQDELSLIQSISQIYVESGLAIAEEVHNRPDFLGLEFDFLACLTEQEAEAWKNEEEALALGLARTTSDFLKDHPARWAREYTRKGRQYARTDFFRGFLHLVDAVVAETPV